jgi:hypothetical protein
VATFLVVVGVGSAMTWAAIAGLRWLGAPGWVAALPWIAPTVGALAWALGRPTPAILTDDDDDSWAGYAVRFVMIGDGTRRSAPVRAVTTVVVGAPVVWALVVFGLATLVGLS